MKKILLSAFVAFAMLASTKSFGQQGFGTNQPDKSAAVDIVSSQRGLLIPRINLTALNVAAPVTAPAQSLLVFNQATSPATVTPADAVTPGFYYWDTNRWVRIISTGSEKNTVVSAGDNVIIDTNTVGLTTTYTVGVASGTQGQVLVTVINSAGDPESKWVDASDFISAVNGVTITPTTDPATGIITNEIGLGGALTEATVITTNATNTFAIEGLEVLDSAAFNPATQNIVVMGSDGILKEVAPKTLIDDAIAAGNLVANDLTTVGDIITLNGGNDAIEDSVLKNVALGIRDRSIGSDKLDPGAATVGQIATVVETTPGDATTTIIQYQNASSAIGQTLTTDNIIGVGADLTAASGATANSLGGAVLTPTYLKIKDNAITALQIGTGAVGTDELATDAVTTDKITDANVTSEKLVAAIDGTDTNKVPVANADGTVEYKTISTAIGQTLTTDGKITVIGGTTATTMDQSVLVPTSIGIASESITSADIKNGTITPADIKGPGSTTDTNIGTVGQVLVTDVATGEVKWVPQSNLANKDNYTFAAPLAKDAGTANTTTGGTDYNVTIATASAATLGVVKQSAATGEEITIASDGSLSVNEANVNLTGDVTGPLNDTNVAAIQGTAVSATAPTANQVMTFASGSWTPTAPTSLVLVDNGISKATDGDIILGGTLNEAATTITTGGASNTLAVAGLVVPTAATSEIIYAEGATGILRKAARSISQYVEASQVVSAISGYNDFVQEVNITAKIVSGDINVTLPAATATNRGQVVNVKIVNPTEVADYLNILVGSTTLTYGALPYQSWIIKSNGSTWEVVGRN